MLGVALETEQANRLCFRERDRLAEIEQRLGLFHMLKKDALEAFDISAARGIAPPASGVPSPRR